jgi:hypothetical protein
LNLREELQTGGGVDGVFAVNEQGESLEGALVTVYNVKLTSESNEYGEIMIVDNSGEATQLDDGLGFDTGRSWLLLSCISLFEPVFQLGSRHWSACGKLVC